MILSRLVLNPLSREVARALTDVHRMHQLVMRGFGTGDSDDNGKARAVHSVLYRTEVDPLGGALVLYVQSKSRPIWSALQEDVLVRLEDAPNHDVRQLLEFDTIPDGQVMSFRLRANATRRIETKSVEGRRRHGRRVPHRDEDRCLAWLIRQGKAGGFGLVESASGYPAVVIIREGQQTGRREGRTLTFEGVRFDGLLRVQAAEAFRSAVARGIGPAKAYGFGLLSFRAVKEG